MTYYVQAPTLEFQSTLPAREATIGIIWALYMLYISIHASREGSDCLAPCLRAVNCISIHASREGSDSEMPITTPRFL